GCHPLRDSALEGGGELAEACPGETDRLGPRRGQHRRRRLGLCERGEKETVQECRRQNRHSAPYVGSPPSGEPRARDPTSIGHRSTRVKAGLRWLTGRRGALLWSQLP